jgi:ATP-dependent protease ClpP protease subunit
MTKLQNIVQAIPLFLESAGCFKKISDLFEFWGSVYAVIRIYDTMQYNGRCYNLYRMAALALVLQCRCSGKTFCFCHILAVMIHQPSGGAQGVGDWWKSTAWNVETGKMSCIKIISQRPGQTSLIKSTKIARIIDDCHWSKKNTEWLMKCWKEVK